MLGMPTQKSTSKSKSDPAVSYDEFKEYEGRTYTGMKIGRSHKWYYDKGEWREKKITPDLWQISYAVTKRRAGKAPEGSGVPVGTGYHWYIVAHQNVTKLNANDYTTSLSGLKFKVAHMRADSGKWSATPKTQRKRMIAFLKDVIADLEREPEDGNGEQALVSGSEPRLQRGPKVRGAATGNGESAEAGKTPRKTRRALTPPSMAKKARRLPRRRRTTK
jgi:hypothetical protein